MNYCSACGGSITHQIPQGDNRLRHICNECGVIHYQNPRIIAGTLPIYDNKVLLCRRAIEPRAGFWTLPAGFMENGETSTEAAIRETKEEADADIDIHGLYALFNLPHISQIYLFFKGDLVDGQFGIGDETLESKLFAEEDIPWDFLAFPTITRTLKRYFDDRKAGEFPILMEDIKGLKPLT